VRQTLMLLLLLHSISQTTIENFSFFVCAIYELFMAQHLAVIISFFNSPDFMFIIIVSKQASKQASERHEARSSSNRKALRK